MLLLETLRRDHDLLERVLASLCAYGDLRARGEGSPHEADAFAAFFLGFGRHHHAAEEDVLFPALVRHAELPAGQGPIRALTDQHEEMAALLARLPEALRSGGPAAAHLARQYAHRLWQHIDAENSVLLPAAEERLTRVGVHELPLPAPTDAARRALDDAQRLLAAWPGRLDPTAWRGEGCVVCPSYGSGCDGLEREWWSDAEWDDFFESVGSD